MYHNSDISNQGNMHGISEVTEEWLLLAEDECSNCFFLKIQGLSNFPDFMEGDYIVVDPNAYYAEI